MDADRFIAPDARWPLPRGPHPSFSVIVPVHNGADVVPEAIQSALEQTLPAEEIIVFDDGSDDDIEHAVRVFGGAVRLLRGSRGGAGAARNRAASHAAGEFVVMLDADDQFAPERLESLAELAARRPDLDVLATDAVVEVGDQPVRRFGRDVPFAVSDQRLAILDRCFFVCPAIRRSRLLAIGGYDESLRSGEDWECAIRLILSGCVAGLVDEPLYVYRLRAGGLTSDRVGSLRDRVRLLEATTAHPGISSAERRALARSLAEKRARLLTAEAEVSIIGGRSDARARALRLARVRGVGPQTRLAALRWALAPGRAALILDEQRRRDGRLASTPPWQR